MILADTSILIAYLRHAPPEIERTLLSGQVAFVWSLDHHFALMQSALPDLRLFSATP